MADYLARDAGIATAQGAAARMRRILTSAEADRFLTEILTTAQTYIEGVAPLEFPEGPRIARAANRDPITNEAYLVARRRNGLRVLDGRKVSISDAIHG